jgi:MFS family permease
MTSTPQSKTYGIWSLPVIVGALGFFVDVYDLLLFSIIRKPSLQSLGLSPEAVLSKGELIISIQMIGLMVGGFLWGIMGDKKGRLSVLFGSILLYSLANIANGMVQTVPQYVLLRFLAGVGLAGELGASITMVSEMLPKEKRGIAATLIACVGVCGAIAAFFVYNYFQDWRLCFYIGGGMGLVLLLLRANIMESGMFGEVKKSGVQRGDLLLLFKKRERAFRYLKGVLIGLPVWYTIGILITFSDKFGNEFGIPGVDPGKAIMYQYVGIGLGDLSAGLLSNFLKSRKRALYTFFSILSVCTVLYFLQSGGRGSVHSMYILCGFLGYGAGFSVLYITMSAEQFGTNLRATTAISIPNVVRGILPLIILLHRGLRSLTNDYVTGGWITGIIIMALAVWAARHTKESFGKDMNFVEE